MTAQTERRWFYRLLQAIIRGIIKLFGTVHVEGVANFPTEGPYIIAINHLHWMDIPVLFIVLPHETATFAAEKWENHWFVGRLLHTFGHAIFVRRGEADRRALVKAINWLKQGGVLGIAPEGTRSRSGVLQPGKPGVAYLASRTGVPVVPVAMWGHEKFWKDVRRLRRPHVHIRVGRPIVFPGTPNRVKGELLDAYTEQIMLAIARMLPEEYRGVYAEKVKQQEHNDAHVKSTRSFYRTRWLEFDRKKVWGNTFCVLHITYGGLWRLLM